MRRTLFEGVEVNLGQEAIVVESKRPLKILSSAPVNGGLRSSSRVVNLKVEKNFSEDPEEHFRARVAPIWGSDAVCLMTAADLTKVEVVERSGEVRVVVIVTAGTSNATSVTDMFPGSGGTINTIIIVDRDLTEGCMANIIISATEAKCKALSSLDVRSFSSRQLATGTSSDAILVASTGNGDAMKYAGSATELGRLVGECVEEAVRGAVVKHDGLLPHRPLASRLKERGIAVEDLVSAAMEMFVPHPKFPLERAKRIFEKHLLEAMEDPNISALIMAAFRMNEDGERGLIPGIDKMSFEGDPVYLVADEILGISIAMQIAGYYGLFEFYRFDRIKPGILARLPPFIDDAIGALIAGASSRMYSDMVKVR
ncbi:MAG: bifunctional adenosylcobinamide hydrolase/alpha-ribazole phosphatase CbiS [Candidatus Verstraetearchaeota archaeon]|nr:bifunctional adenosylcobinamide hydrolase/alpha-ribazole phosphatase CbiS [Candidatus Verstraetearchaeota archaeon]